jgi:hypothetical protein
LGRARLPGCPITATELAGRAAVLHQQTGPRAEHRHIQTRARAAEADYPHTREAAQRRDREATGFDGIE